MRSGIRQDLWVHQVETQPRQTQSLLGVGRSRPTAYGELQSRSNSLRSCSCTVSTPGWLLLAFWLSTRPTPEVLLK